MIFENSNIAVQDNKGASVWCGVKLSTVMHI